MSVGESYYRFETVDGCLIVTLLPELNDKQWADIERVGTEIVDRLSTVQSPRLIVDLSALSYMGSAMVALIVRLYKAVTGRSGQMVVVNQHDLVFEVLKLAGLTKLWTIVESREKAFSTLGIKRRAVAAAGGGPAPQGGTAILLAGIIGTVGAVIGLALQFSSQPLVTRKVALLIEVAFAALGMIVGTMILVNQTGGRRNVGIVFLAICLLVVLGGIVAGPEQPGGQPKPAPNATSATASTPTTDVAASAPTTNTATTNTAASAAPVVTNVAASAPVPAKTSAAVSAPPAGSTSRKPKDK